MKLIAVTDGKRSMKELSNIIISIKDKIDYVQIREKTKPAQVLLALIDDLLARGMEKEKIIINDRLDIVLLSGIPNLHLPEYGIPVQRVKKRYPKIQVGCSVHSLEKARECEKNGADYVLYGHCFETASKKGIPPNGMPTLLQIKKMLKIPVYAIGGITLDKVQVVKQTEADGVAVMSSIFQADEPNLVIKEYREAIG